MNQVPELDVQHSALQLADKLVHCVRQVVATARTEEDLQIGLEKLLDPLLKSIGVEPKPRYERVSRAKTIYRGRPDAVHGHVIIEYKRPHAFSSEQAVLHAHDQLVAHMMAEAQATRTDPVAALNGFAGVGFDGASIFFVQHARKGGANNKTIGKEAFIRRGPYPFDSESARTFVTYLRSLSRLPLTAEHLADTFGPESNIAPMVVSALADALQNWSSRRVLTFFREWKRLFGIVYGEKFNASAVKEPKLFRHLYHVRPETAFQEVLFCVHTYFALLMKLICTELITLGQSPLGSSLCHELSHTSKGALRAQLAALEDGGIFAAIGITNFLEGDFFRWYLDAFSPRLEDAVREIARALSEFEPATTSIDPEAARDLLKKLYQYLVPQEVRHGLGEYYTPDWLAEFLLDRVGYDGNPDKRLLDPACGSGTFLVLAIQRAKDYGRTSNEPPLETAKRIVSNVWGFDLNPLAVIAARTNYLFALGGIASRLSQFEMRIYHADSVLWRQAPGQMDLGPPGDSVGVKTSVATFFVPRIWVRDKGFLMRAASPIIEEMVRASYSPSDAVERLKKEGLVFPPHEEIVKSFFQQVLDLEKSGDNGIWARFLKNAFAPMTAEKFDFVVGNPPWIRWGYLSQEYRNETLDMWKQYGLFSLKGHAARLGGGEKDFSMLFTYAAADTYLKKGGMLGFLITQEAFKSKGAGEGFRRFRLGAGEPLKVAEVHDFVSVQPFEGAANKTALVVLKKGAKTEYPVPYTVWTRRRGTGKLPTTLSLEQARPFLHRRPLLAQPIGSPTGSWQTFSADQTSLTTVAGQNPYQARSGASTDPYGVFRLEVKQVLSNGELIVLNLLERVKRSVEQVEERIEPDLVFPAVRGSDIERWLTKPRIFILMSQNPQTREPYPERQMKRQWPRTYAYLTRFKDVLLTRGSRTIRELAERTAFYAMFGIGPHTVAQYKVVWKRMASDIVAAVVSQAETPFGYKTVIPTDTTALFATDNEPEACYLCAVVNSAPVRNFIRSYSSAGRGFGAPSVMSHVRIPKFDPRHPVHNKLAQLSEALHRLKADSTRDEIPPLEKEVDALVSDLFDIKDSRTP